MKRGSTPPITITIPNVDVTGADWIIVSISRRGYKAAIELTGDRLTVTCDDSGTSPVSVIALQLTQEESLMLGAAATVDVNWLKDGQREGIIPTGVSLINTLLNREVET